MKFFWPVLTLSLITVSVISSAGSRLVAGAAVRSGGVARGEFQNHREGAPARLDLPPETLAETQKGMDQVFRGDPDAALLIAQHLETSQPDHPIGHLLEAEARWWKIYCESCTIRYNLIDGWSRDKLPEDAACFAAADRATRLAEEQISQNETATLHVLAGMGYALKARFYGLRGENLSVARAGVKGREHFLRALELEPGMGDALTGIGLYNYLADALSPMAKMLRFFMGIPGGNKKQGIRQLETAMNTAELTAAEARFYLARNLRNFDEKYERAAQLLEPLVTRYPENPSFQLLLGDMYAKLNRKEPAERHFHAAFNLHPQNAACAARTRELAAASLDALERGREKP